MSDKPKDDETPLKREYWCFISYKHTDNKEEGRQWATWLHQQLETYEVPEDLVDTPNEIGELLPQRIFPVFRDEEELGAGSHLTERIYSALSNTRVLVVLCSPRVIESPYVDAEIRYFKKIGGEEATFAAVIDGDPGSRTIEPGKCFPDPLQFKVDENGDNKEDSPIEPLAADFRLPDGTQGWTSPEAYRQVLEGEDRWSKKQINEMVARYAERLELAKLRLISGILKVPLGILQKRDKAYQLKQEKHRAKIFRRVAATMFLLLVATTLGGYGFFLQKEAAEVARAEEETQRKIAEENEEQALRESGRYWLQKAKLADSYPAKQIFAAKAIAFQNHGPKFSKHPFWKSIPSQRLDPLKDPIEFEEARLILNSAEGLDGPPILIWSSPQPAIHFGPITCVAFSPDGRQLISGSKDSLIKIWSTQSGKLIDTLKGHTGGITSVAFSPDGKDILSGSEDNSIKLWDAQSRNLLRTLKGHTQQVTSVVFSADSGQILSGSSDSTVKLWSGQSGKLLQTFWKHSDGVMSVAFSPDCNQVLSGANDGTIELWSVKTGKSNLNLMGDSRGVASIAFSPDGSQIVSGSEDNSINLWDVKSGRLRRTLKGHGKQVTSVGFSADGNQILSGSLDNTIKLWDTQSGKLDRTIVGYFNSYHSFNDVSVAFNSEGTQIISASGGTTIQLWDIQSGMQLNHHDGHSRGVTSADFSPDGRQFVSGSRDNTIKLWSMKSGRLLSTFKGHTSDVTSVEFSPDGKGILSGSMDHTIKLWDAQSGKLLYTLEDEYYPVEVAFSPDGLQFLSRHIDGAIRQWGAKTGESLNIIGNRGWEDIRGRRSVAYSPNGSQIILGNSYNPGDNNSRIEILDVNGGEEINSFVVGGILGNVSSVAISPNGQKLVSGYSESKIELWEVESAKLLHTLEGHSDAITSVCFSPNGNQILSGSSDNTVKLWEVESGKLLYSVEGHSRGVTSTTFSPDGSHILSGSEDNTIKVWVAPDERLLQTIKLYHKDYRINEVDYFTISKDIVSSVAFSPDGSQIISDSGGEIRIWDAQTGIPLKNLGYTSVDPLYSSDGSRILSDSSANERLWDGRSGELLHTFEEWEECISFSPDGLQILSRHRLNNAITIWESQSGKLLHSFDGFDGPVLFSPDGSQILCQSSGSTKIWNAKSGELLHSYDNFGKFLSYNPGGSRILSYHKLTESMRLWDSQTGKILKTYEGPVEIACFIPDGSRIISNASSLYRHGSIKVWDTESGELKCYIQERSYDLINPDGSRLLSYEHQEEIEVWDVNSGELQHLFKGHSGIVKSVAFSPDGKLLASGSEDSSIKLWSMQSGKLLYTFKGHTRDVTSVMFSPNGKQIISCSMDGSFRIWDSNIDSRFQSRMDVSEYIRQRGGSNQWVNIDSTGELRWLPSENLLHDKQFSFINSSRDFLRTRLEEADSREHEARILAVHYRNRRDWKLFWANWLQISESGRAQVAKDITPSFALLAANPPPSYPPGWFEKRFFNLRKYSNIDGLDHHLYASAFGRGIVNREKGMGFHLEPIAEEKLRPFLLKSPGNQLALAILRFRQGALEEANTIVSNLVLGEDDIEAETLISYCFQAISFGRVQEAQWLLDAGKQIIADLDKSDNQADRMVKLAVVQFALGHGDTGIAYIRNVIESDSVNTPFVFGVPVVNFQMAENSDAGKALLQKGFSELRQKMKQDRDSRLKEADDFGHGNPLLLSNETYGYYNTKKGESLEDIARTFFTSEEELQRLNGLGAGSEINSGDEIIVPTSKYLASLRKYANPLLRDDK